MFQKQATSKPRETSHDLTLNSNFNGFFYWDHWKSWHTVTDCIKQTIYTGQCILVAQIEQLHKFHSLVQHESLTLLQSMFQLQRAVRFISGGKWSTHRENHLLQVTDKLYYIEFYQVHLIVSRNCFEKKYFVSLVLNQWMKFICIIMKLNYEP
jgi:hypothetical protein